MINSICSKQCAGFEHYAKRLTLSEYARLKSAVAVIIRRISREEMDRKKVRSVD